MSDTSDMSDSEPETPLSPFSPGRAGFASVLTEFTTGQRRGPLEFDAADALVAMNDDVYDVEKEIEDGEGKVDNERNAEQQAFMGLPPPGDVVDDNVNGDSQFSDSTPRAAGATLRQELTSLCALRDSLKSQILANGEDFFNGLVDT